MLMTMLITYFVVDDYRNLRTYVHPTLVGTEYWLEAVSRVFLKILGWANLNHVRTYVRTTLGWKPGPTFWNLNLNHVRTYFTWLEAWTYVRTYVLESQSELVALTPILKLFEKLLFFFCLLGSGNGSISLNSLPFLSRAWTRSQERIFAGFLLALLHK